MWYNLSVCFADSLFSEGGFPFVQPLSQRLRAASSPGRGASGEEVKFAECQGLSYKESLTVRCAYACDKPAL